VGHTHPAPPNLNGVWAWADMTGVADPGPGSVATDSATMGVSTTVVMVSAIDGAGSPSAVWWTAVRAGDTVMLTNKDKSGFLVSTVRGAVVDHASWVEIPVTGTDGTGNPATGNDMLLVWLPN
jgi:hypothetical protein